MSGVTYTSSEEVIQRIRVDLRAAYLSAETVDQCLRQVASACYDHGIDIPHNWLDFCLEHRFSNGQLPPTLFHYTSSVALRSILHEGIVPGSIPPGRTVARGQLPLSWFSALGFFKFDPRRTEFRVRLEAQDVFKIEIDTQGLQGFLPVREAQEVWTSDEVVPPDRIVSITAINGDPFSKKFTVYEMKEILLIEPPPGLLGTYE